MHSDFLFSRTRHFISNYQSCIRGIYLMRMDCCVRSNVISRSGVSVEPSKSSNKTSFLWINLHLPSYRLPHHHWDLELPGRLSWTFSDDEILDSSSELSRTNRLRASSCSFEETFITCADRFDGI